jgi:hypothetical protein
MAVSISPSRAAPAQAVAPLILVSKGDLWSWTGTSAPLKQLTHWGHNSDLVVSPDAKWAAYLSEPKVYVNAFPDGAAGITPENIWLMNLETGNALPVADQPPGAYLSSNYSEEKYKFATHSLPSWSPDSKFLAYSEYVTDAEKGGQRVDTCRLLIYDVATGQAHVVLSDLYGRPMSGGEPPRVAWSETGIAVELYSDPVASQIGVYNATGKLLAISHFVGVDEFFSTKWVKVGTKDYLALNFAQVEPLNQQEYALVAGTTVFEPRTGQWTRLAGLPELYSLTAPNGLTLIAQPDFTGLQLSANPSVQVRAVGYPFIDLSPSAALSPDGTQVAYLGDSPFLQNEVYIYQDGRVTEVQMPGVLNEDYYQNIVRVLPLMFLPDASLSTYQNPMYLCSEPGWVISIGEAMQRPMNELTDQLKSSDPAVREAALHALGMFHDSGVLDALKKVQTQDPDPKLRQLVAQLAGQSPVQLTQPAAQSGIQVSSDGKAGENVFQMLWDCRFCGAKKLLGVDARHCPNCGAAQDPEWRYFPSEADKKIVSDPNYAYAGVDKICPFCGQPNSAAAKFCKDCGGDLIGAKDAVRKANVVTGLGEDAPGVVEDVALKKAQAEQTAISAASKPRGKITRTQIIVLGIVALFIGIGAIVSFLALSKHAASVTVSDVSWQRVINVEQYNALHESNWQDSVPIGAYSQSCYAKDRPHDETYTEACGIERIDNGNGSFTEREKTCTRIRTVYTPDTYCNYVVNRWTSITPLQTSGGPNDAPVWPNFVPLQTSGLGAQRESSRSQTLKVMFKDTGQANRTFTYNPPDENKWRSFQPGQQYNLEVNGLNIPDWSTLKSVGAQ